MPEPRPQPHRSFLENHIVRWAATVEVKDRRFPPLDLSDPMLCADRLACHVRCARGQVTESRPPLPPSGPGCTRLGQFRYLLSSDTSYQLKCSIHGFPHVMQHALGPAPGSVLPFERVSWPFPPSCLRGQSFRTPVVMGRPVGAVAQDGGLGSAAPGKEMETGYLKN